MQIIKYTFSSQIKVTDYQLINQSGLISGNEITNRSLNQIFNNSIRKTI